MMTVDDLIADLRSMPREAPVVVQIRTNITYDGQTEELYECREVDPEVVIYGHGVVRIQLDE